jgi:hypothetical protein
MDNLNKNKREEIEITLEGINRYTNSIIQLYIKMLDTKYISESNKKELEKIKLLITNEDILNMGYDLKDNPSVDFKVDGRIRRHNIMVVNIPDITKLREDDTIMDAQGE